MSEERFWNTDEYTSTAKFAVPDGVMTMRQAGRIFCLDPAPPKVENINEYIISAIREQDNTYFTYFLHHYEPRLNKRVYRFLRTSGLPPTGRSWLIQISGRVQSCPWHCMALQQFRQERKRSHCRICCRAELFRRNCCRVSDPCKTKPQPCSSLFNHAGRGQRGNGRGSYL